MVSSNNRFAGKPSVLLVSMPWTTIHEPNLGLSLLRAVLDTAGISCRVLNLNLFLLEHLQANTYHAIANVYALNDFVFSGVLDPAVTNTQLRALRPKVQEMLDQCLIDMSVHGSPQGVVDALLTLRNVTIPEWLKKWADEIAASNANLIGFSCMFDQTIASVALAQMVHERAPEKMLVLGGYAVRTPTAQMLLNVYPWIDAICDGEGEVTIVELAHAAVGEIPLSHVHGIVFRSDSGNLHVTESPPPADLDTNPLPNYDDFFKDIQRLSDEYQVDVTPRNLPIENSRGCWWGNKHHCIFCGIRDEDLNYRSRDHRGVLNSLEKLKKTYGTAAYRFSDYILPYRYFESLIPELTRLERAYMLSAEIKANITTKHFAMLAQAGFEEVQPGIESFNSDTLRKMNKGVSAVQNVHTMMLGRRFGVRILFNLLYGFPDDDTSSYENMTAMLPRLTHLDPPVTCVPVQITRWAPLQVRPQDFGIEKAQPEPAYDAIFSRSYLEKTGFKIDDFCFYFERPFENSVELHRKYDRIIEIVKGWRRLFAARQSWLYWDIDEFLIHDKRGEKETVYRLDAADAKVLLACEDPVSLHTLQERCREVAPSHAIEEIIARLDSLGLVFVDDDHLVSLVLPEPPKPGPVYTL